MTLPKHVSCAIAVFMVILGATAVAKSQLAQPLVSEDTLKQASEHVYVLAGFPNIGIVVGSRGTLVIDTGLGERNGATVVRVAQKLAKGPRLYLTNTHYHSEHTAGEQAFPPDTILVRLALQQQEMNQRVGEHLNAFRGMSAQNRDLLQEVKFRSADILFDREMKLDLGGVTTRLFYLGPAHTKADMLILVQEDSVLFPGDIVQQKIFPIMPNEDSSVKGWLAILEQLKTLSPRVIIPDHGTAVTDVSEIGNERAYLLDLQTRASALKRQAVPVDDAGKQVAVEFQTKYPDWQGSVYIPNEVKRVYEQTQ
jgi:glyoxylase-like metal-dependent hydrolase (beta-lactamase superfamily II)